MKTGIMMVMVMVPIVPVLGILQLQSKQPLDAENLKYVTHIERDKIFTLDIEEE